MDVQNPLKLKYSLEMGGLKILPLLETNAKKLKSIYFKYFTKFI